MVEFRAWPTDRRGRLLPLVPCRITIHVTEFGPEGAWPAGDCRIEYASGVKFRVSGSWGVPEQELPASAWEGFLDDLALKGELDIHFEGCDHSRCAGCDGSAVGRSSNHSTTKEKHMAVSSPRDRELRLMRAAREVLVTYTLVPTGVGEITVQGGRKPYVVRFCPSWTREPKCDCPDGSRPGIELYCKHVVAVLMSQVELRPQLLELFL